jgi:hypothetical protein
MRFRDIRQLLAHPDLDREYLSRRINELGLDETLNEARDERYDA